MLLYKYVGCDDDDDGGGGGDYCFYVVYIYLYNLIDFVI